MLRFVPHLATTTHSMPATRQHIISNLSHPPPSPAPALQSPHFVELFTQHLLLPLPSQVDTCLICLSLDGMARETGCNTVGDLMFVDEQPDDHAGGCGR